MSFTISVLVNLDDLDKLEAAATTKLKALGKSDSEIKEILCDDDLVQPVNVLTVAALSLPVVFPSTVLMVDAATDVSLNDNAQGTPNFAAPGAHRYKIATELIKEDPA